MYGKREIIDCYCLVIDKEQVNNFVKQSMTWWEWSSCVSSSNLTTKFKTSWKKEDHKQRSRSKSVSAKLKILESWRIFCGPVIRAAARCIMVVYVTLRGTKGKGQTLAEVTRSVWLVILKRLFWVNGNARVWYVILY